MSVAKRRATLLSMILDAPDAPAEEPPMTTDQLKVLKQLAQNNYEIDAYSPNLTRDQIEWRIAALKAKLKLLDEPPHTL